MTPLILFLRRLRAPAMLFLAALPPVLLGTCLFAPAASGAAAMLLLAAAALCAGLTAVPGRFRKAAAAAAAMSLPALSALLLPLRSQPLLLALPLAAAALLLFALPLAGRAAAETAPAFYLAGAASYLIGHAFIHFARGALRIRYDALSPVLTAAFAAYLLLLLLSMNSVSLDNATMGRRQLPASMRRINTLLTVFFLAASVLLACLPALPRLIRLCMNALRALFRLIGDLVTRLLGSAPGGTGGGGSPMIPGFPAAAEAQEPSFFSVLFEKLVTVLAAAAVIVGLYLLARILLRKAYALALRLLAHLRACAAAVSEDYEDEITDTRSENERTDAYALRLKRRFARSAPPGEPAARIRWRYARLLSRKKTSPPSATARETLPPDAAAIYERARYSDLPVTQADADRFDRDLRGL